MSDAVTGALSAAREAHAAAIEALQRAEVATQARPSKKKDGGVPVC